MNQLLEEKLEKPDPAFEQRVLANFRERVPEKNRNILQLLVGLMHLRSAQIAGVAAVLLALVQVGRMVTGESSRASFASGMTQPLGLSKDYENRLAAYRQAAAEVDVLNKMIAAPALAPEAKAQKAEERDEKVENLKKMERDLQNVAAIGGLARSEGPPPPPQPPAGQPEFPEKPSQRAKMSQSEASAEDSSVQEYAMSRAPNEGSGKSERVIVTGSNIPVAEEVGPNPSETPSGALANRKLTRNATVELEIASFDDAVQKITALANEERGYVATTSSEKQENGKLKGEIVAKVLPENLDRFLQELRGLGELKNQTLATEDVTKAYFDTGARLKNARVMEQRLIEMLKTKTGKVSDLLEVERELARVREGIEKMQGELKYWDSQVQFATVTIALSEKDLEEPAAFLLQEHAQLSLFVSDVEKTYNDIRAMASSKVQITNAQLDRDNSGRVVAHLGMLIVPEESEAVLARVKETGRIDNFVDQTSRVAQGGNGLSENAKTKRDQVSLNIALGREAEEQPIQETSLRILTSNVDQNAARLKDEAVKSGAEVRDSNFSRDPNGREVANMSLRVAMKNYPALMKSLNQLGQVKDVSVQRHDKANKNGSEENAPADLSIQIYSQGNIVASDTGIFATLRRTIGQSAGAIMWSVRMIGVAIAFLAPWVIALVALIWIVMRIKRTRRSR